MDKRVFRRSRWHFWWAYLLITVLFILAIHFYDRAADLLSYFCTFFAFVLLAVYEFIIRRSLLVVSSDSVKLIGFGDERSISFSDISDVDVSQSKVERVFSFGSISIKSPDRSFSFDGIVSPAKVADLIYENIHSGSSK